MTVEQTKIIDTIGIDKVSGNVVLSIIDSLDWEEEDKHLLLLQAKINSYLSFVESGEMLESYFRAGTRPKVIKISFLYEPPDSAQEFLRTAKTILEEAGFGLEVTR